MARDYSIADNILAFCALRGINQRELACAIDLPEATVSRWCTGVVAHPRPALLARLCDVYGITYEHLTSPDQGFAYALELVREAQAERR